MQNLKWIPLFCLTLTSLFATSEGEAEFQIKKFRFNRHLKLRFERLVLEFSSKIPGKEVPNIRLVPDKLGKETTIHVSKASLFGAIPESSINEAYVKKSQYFGPVSVNTDTTAGFEIRTFMKQSNSIVDAFWLQNPSRLIVDVFPKDSDRAMGPNVVNKRAPASVATPAIAHAPASVAVEPESKKSVPESVKLEEVKSLTPEKNWTQMEKPEDEMILCFPVNTQVKANIGFEKGNGHTGNNIAQAIDNTYSSASEPAQDNIVCYPKGAQVTPLLKFQPHANNYYGRADLDSLGRPNPRQPSSVGPTMPGYNPYLPQMAPPMGYPGNNYYNNYMPPQRLAPPISREQSFNNDADVALALPDDSISTPRSQNDKGFSSSDNFNQKVPPLSLGKKLPSPFKSKQ